MKLPQPRPPEPLPGGATTEQIAAALAELTTARATYQVMLREATYRGEGVTDFSRRISSWHLDVKGKTVEHLDVGGDGYHKLSTDQQQRAGKLWRWEYHCPYGDDDLWAQIVGALCRCGWFAGGSSELMNGEPVHRYSFLISPKRNKRDPAAAFLHAHLRAHRIGPPTLHVWLADDVTLRKVRLHYPRADVLGARQQGSQETDYVDFGIAVDLAAPSADQITGKPRQLRDYRRARRSRQPLAAAGPSS